MSKPGHSTLRSEMIAGLTTFLSMAYIIFVNPSVLSNTGMDFKSVMIATCLAAALGTFLIGALTNLPFAQAPGMGLNAFFTYTVVLQMGYTWQQALGVVFVSGILFLLLTITGWRGLIMKMLPRSILKGIPAGIGLFITMIGLNSSGIIVFNQGPIISIINQSDDKAEMIDSILNVKSQVIQFGHFSDIEILLAIIGVFILIALLAAKIKGAILWSILITTVIGLVAGNLDLPDQVVQTPDISATFFKLDLSLYWPFGESDFKNFLNVIILTLAFSLVDIFDSMGTLYGTAHKGGFLDENGHLPKMNRAMIADATATTVGALLGTSTTTTYIESATGIAAGGKTKIVSYVVAFLFLACIFFAPMIGIVPIYATAPALVIVGLMMLDSIQEIDFQKIEEAIPAFLVMTIIPFAYGIADGIGIGLIAYCVILIFQNRGRGISPIVAILTFLFLLKFILLG